MNLGNGKCSSHKWKDKESYHPSPRAREIYLGDLVPVFLVRSQSSRSVSTQVLDHAV